MAHVNILSLPIEIIQVIGSYQPQLQDGQDEDFLSLKTLRLVCSQFNRAFEAQVLSTLVILVNSSHEGLSLYMLWTFASQNKETSRAVQLARTLKIKCLSPMSPLHPKLARISQPEPESRDLSPSPPSLIRRLATAISSHTRRYKRKPKSETSEDSENFMKAYLELAISSMKNVENVRWAVQKYDPYWTEATVIRGLARLPQLQDLQLTLNRHDVHRSYTTYDILAEHIQLDRLSGLKKISLLGNHAHHPRDIIGGLAGLIAKSHQLVHLEVKLGHCGISLETPTLHDVLRKVPEDHPLQLTHLALDRTGICVDSSTLPHLRSLISLDLRNLPAPSNLIDDANLTSERLERACSTSDICAILKQEDIYLKHVVVSDVVGVFDYLCSYSGLETLDLYSMSFNTVKESNTFAHTFYEFVLPQLAHSLQVLKIRPNEEGQWCFNPEHVFALSQCNKLRSLSVALNSTSIIQSVNYLDGVLHLHHFKDNLDDEISSLIKLSLRLPTLGKIYIVIPKFGLESDVVILYGDSDNMARFYEEIVIGLVTRSITDFSLHVGHNIPHIGQLLPDIWVYGEKLFQYQTLGGDDGERQSYKLTYQKLLDPYHYEEGNTQVRPTIPVVTASDFFA